MLGHIQQIFKGNICTRAIEPTCNIAGRPQVHNEAIYYAIEMSEALFTWPVFFFSLCRFTIKFNQVYEHGRMPSEIKAETTTKLIGSNRVVSMRCLEIVGSKAQNSLNRACSSKLDL